MIPWKTCHWSMQCIGFKNPLGLIFAANIFCCHHNAICFHPPPTHSIRRKLQPILLLLVTVKWVSKSGYFKHNNWSASQSLCLKNSLSKVILFEHSCYCSHNLCVNINPVIYRIWAWITPTMQLLHFSQSRREAARVHPRVSRNQVSFMPLLDDL